MSQVCNRLFEIGLKVPPIPIPKRQNMNRDRLAHFGGASVEFGRLPVALFNTPAPGIHFGKLDNGRGMLKYDPSLEVLGSLCVATRKVSA